MGRRAPRAMLPTYRRVLSMIEDGHSLNEIARTLSAEQVPTSNGGHWHASTVIAIRDSRTAENLLAALTDPNGRNA
jgi:hypothetical protein